MKFLSVIMLAWGMGWLIRAYNCIVPTYLTPHFLHNRVVHIERKYQKEHLRIKGLCMHSGYGLKSMSTTVTNRVMEIKIRLQWQGKGTLDEQIEIPSDVTMIRWEGLTLWERGKCIVTE